MVLIYNYETVWQQQGPIRRVWAVILVIFLFFVCLYYKYCALGFKTLMSGSALCTRISNFCGLLRLAPTYGSAIY